MEIDNLPDHIVYSPQVIDFVTVAAETCLFLEHATDLSREEFVSKGAKILALLYLKAAVLEIPERVYEDMTERFVSEEDYNDVKGQLELLLGEKDSYLETFHPDMSLSDTPIAAFISENLTDVYQELKDFAANYQLADTDVMNDALVTCLETFGEHWGQKALNALRALHNIRYSGGVGIESQGDQELPTGKLDKNTFLGYLREDDEDINPYL
ncbi:MAG: DUF5063 domain-containing protein [Paludibacter sp.]|nr:DUF5063 domain-containing protein [Paludibacter sp.]